MNDQVSATARTSELDDFLANRDKCVPISETERDANPNLGTP